MWLIFITNSPCGYCMCAKNWKVGFMSTTFLVGFFPQLTTVSDLGTAVRSLLTYAALRPGPHLYPGFSQWASVSLLLVDTAIRRKYEATTKQNLKLAVRITPVKGKYCFSGYVTRQHCTTKEMTPKERKEPKLGDTLTWLLNPGLVCHLYNLRHIT